MSEISRQRLVREWEVVLLFLAGPLPGNRQPFYFSRTDGSPETRLVEVGYLALPEF